MQTDNFVPFMKKVINEPLVLQQKMYSPPLLHMKLGLVKNFDKALNTEGNIFEMKILACNVGKAKRSLMFGIKKKTSQTESENVKTTSLKLQCSK